MKAVQRETNNRKVPLTLELNPFRSKAKEKHSGIRLTESGCARKEIVDNDILITSRNDDRKIMQPIRTTSAPVKQNQFSQVR